MHLACTPRLMENASTQSRESTRDVIVIGASAGGIDALSRLVSELPADLPASVLIVQHLSDESPGVLASILGRRSALSVAMAEDRMPLVRGRIYVAPADRHMLLAADGVRVVFGARENRSRPAIDPLFRTAAVNYGARVIGIILTGMLADGAAGLRAVARCGGVAVVQTPEDAAFAEMPRNALRRVPAAHAVSLVAMPALIDRLTRETAGASPPVPDSLRIEAALTERAMPADDWNEVPGSPTRFTCPECSGALQAIEEEGDVRYRCRVGHAYSAPDLLAAKHVALEDSLWIALQTPEERADMLRTLARADQERGWEQTAQTFERRAAEPAQHAEVLRAAIRELRG